MREFYLSINKALLVDSSMGNLLKWVVQDNGTTLFIKTSTYTEANFKPMWMYESYSEVIVSKLARELGIDNILQYYLCKIHLDNGLSTIGCYSYSFLKQTEKTVTLAHLNKLGKLQNYMFEGYNGYINCISDIEKLTGIDYKDELDKIITLDYIILNEDRHTGNFGFVMDIPNKKVKIAPIFDNGNSLFSLKHVEGMNYSKSLEKYARSKPFYHRHVQQLEMIRKPYKLNTNIVETYEYIDNLIDYGLSNERAEFIKQMLRERLNEINEYN